MCSQLLLELLQGQGAARLPVQRCGAGCVPVATEKCWQLCACVKLGGITDLSLSAVAADGTPRHKMPQCWQLSQSVVCVLPMAALRPVCWPVVTGG